MKIKNILVSFVAILALAAGCNQIEPDHFLSEVQVSSSYVAIPMAGGSTSITVESTESWTLSGMPSWLTVSPTSGNGSTNVSFSAAQTLDGRTAELVMTCGSKTQNINVIQGLATVSQATCAEVLAGPESKTYLVTGICTKIANTSYGNWYLDDGTGEIYIYGTVNASGSYAWSSFNIEVGDEVTVQGPKSVYNGTVELVDATFISVNKSLIKVEEVDPEDATIPTAGGTFTVKLSNKGTGVYVDVPEAAQSWLSISSISGNTVTFRATENTAGPRNATLVFRTTDGKKEYSTETSVTQLGASGSKELPFTVEEAIAYVQGLGGETSGDFYVKGIVSQIANNGQFGAQYGNGTFWISSDGVYNNDLSKDFEAYRVLWFDNQKWAEGNAPIAVGAEVVICGKFTVYKGTAETSSGKAYVYSVNGVTNDKDGIGTLENPFNIAGAKAAIDAGVAANVYVKGIVSSIANNGQFGAQYGNGTFWISDDGKSNDFEAYRVLWLGNKKWVEGNDPIAVGDEVILHGLLTKYGSTYETSSGKAYVYSVNGKTE